MTDYSNPEYELRWPKDVFLREAGCVAGHDAARILIEDAFVNGAEVIADTWDDAPILLRDLVANADNLRQRSLRRPYWSERKTGLDPGTLDFNDLAASFAELIEDFGERGYFERVFGADCVDNPRQGTDPALELKHRLGRDDLWPLRKSTRSWDQDMLFDLVEVFHDLAARPTDGRYHSFANCGWDYSRHSSRAGREVYRWEVNHLLDRGGVKYRLAATGEDSGRMVAITDDGREDLVEEMLQGSGPNQGRIEHAIALFRSRTATRDNKRSAVRSLADILEEKRDLLREELLKKDEAALFMIANQFDIRHHRADQRPDYDDAYLDWLFWWYLGTVELLGRLLASQGRTSA